MEIIKRPTENPDKEQWQIISQFFYPTNIKKYFHKNGKDSIDQGIIDLIAGSISQSYAFFTSAKKSSIDIAPLLLYYGASNLLIGTYALLTKEIPLIKRHGMRLSIDPDQELAQSEIIPSQKENGALFKFNKIFSNQNITLSGSWKLEEIFGSIPDLKKDFENHYDLQSHVLPIESIKSGDRIIDRILIEEIIDKEQIKYLENKIVNYKKCYLESQVTKKFIILNRKFSAEHIGTYSILGKKYVEVGFQKSKDLVFPNQILSFFMGLYALSFIQRYKPEIWFPFIVSDKTGEKFIIEKFVSICERYLPNLVLDYILGHHILFSYESEEILG